MKRGRDLHVPKSEAMKRNYIRYINTLDYQPTVDERLDFQDTNQDGEDFSTTKTSKKRPADLNERIKEHFSSNWMIWVSAIFAMGILYFINDSKVALTRFDTILTNHNEKFIDLKNTDDDLKRNDRSQDLKIQENRMLIDQIKQNFYQTETKIDKVIDSKQRR